MCNKRTLLSVDCVRPCAVEKPRCVAGARRSDARRFQQGQKATLRLFSRVQKRAASLLASQDATLRRFRAFEKRAQKRRCVVACAARSDARRFWQARKPGSASLLRRPYVTIDQRPRATHLGDSFEDHFPRVWGRQSKIPRSLGSFIHRRFSLHALARPQDQTTAFVEARDADAVRWFSWK